jgi:putative two-component system response regulator
MNKQSTLVANLMAVSASETANLISGADGVSATQTVQALAEYARQALQAGPNTHRAEVDRIAEVLLLVTGQETAVERIKALIDCCAYYHRLGQSGKAIPVCEHARELAHQVGDKPLARQCCNMLGAFYRENLDYRAALGRLDEALLLARELNNRVMESAALANISATFEDMGLYRDAIRINEQILSHRIDGPYGLGLRLQCLTNSLACSVRLRDSKAARRYVASAERLPKRFDINPLTAASFEYHRAMQLIRENNADYARQLVEEARAAFHGAHDPRVEAMLGIAAGICEVGVGRTDIGMTRLRTLYEKTRVNHLYHEDVLRALIESCENTGDTTRALAYTEELIDYSMHVKKIKYTEQMRAACQLVRPRSTTPEELKLSEASAAQLRLTQLREMSAEYRTAENWAVVAELVDDETGEHCFRVGRLAGLLARELGYDEAAAAELEYAARLHDIGKIGISHALLLKPGRLTPHELAIVRTHTATGAELLEGSDDPILRLAAQIARHHHEWWNGNGYPDGLTGEAIPLPARIVALADVYDALTHDRPFRRAWSHAEAVAEIVSQQGAHFDPRLSAVFLKVLERYRQSGAAYTGDFHQLARESTLLTARKKLAAAIG